MIAEIDWAGWVAIFWSVTVGVGWLVSSLYKRFGATGQKLIDHEERIQNIEGFGAVSVEEYDRRHADGVALRKSQYKDIMAKLTDLRTDQKEIDKTNRIEHNNIMEHLLNKWVI